MDQSLCEDFRACGCQIVEKLLPRTVLVPESEGSISQLIHLAADRRLRLRIIGSGSSYPTDFKPPSDVIFVMMARFISVLELSLSDAMVIVEAGVLTSDLRQHLNGTELQLPAVLANYPGTVGGALLGPDVSLMRHAEIKRRLLGVDLIDGRGRSLSFGRRTVKNVAGYDYWAFLVGTAGRFGVLTRLTLNLEKLPPISDLPLSSKTTEHADHSTSWILANLEKKLDPDGIFAR